MVFRSLAAKTLGWDFEGFSVHGFVRWPAEDCFCTGLIVMTSSLSLPAVGGKKWSTIWCSLMGIEWRKISSSERMRPSLTRRPSFVTGIHCEENKVSFMRARGRRGERTPVVRRGRRRNVNVDLSIERAAGAAAFARGAKRK